MRVCGFCEKKIDGHANKRYCSNACKRAAYLSRKNQQKVTEKQTLKNASRKDLNYIGNHSPEAMAKLQVIFTRFGKDAFIAALDACYIAVVDVVE